MSDEGEEDQIRLPEDEEAVIEMADGKTDEEKALALAQARLIGDID